MANRLRGMRHGGARSGGLQARPIMAGGRRRGPGPRARIWLGWVAAAAGIAVVAFFVGRAGSEVGLVSPSPSPSVAISLPITFGTALDPVSGKAVELTDRFRSGDPFAYSVELAAAPGVDQILVEIVRFEGGAETVVQQPDEQGIDASSRIIAFSVPTATLLAAWGPGSYEMRIYLADPDPVARGTFTLVETPTAS
jgi:hypothetical protein